MKLNSNIHVFERFGNNIPNSKFLVASNKPIVMVAIERASDFMILEFRKLWTGLNIKLTNENFPRSKIILDSPEQSSIDFWTRLIRSKTCYTLNLWSVEQCRAYFHRIFHSIVHQSTHLRFLLDSTLSYRLRPFILL